MESLNQLHKSFTQTNVTDLFLEFLSYKVIISLFCLWCWGNIHLSTFKPYNQLSERLWSFSLIRHTSSPDLRLTWPVTQCVHLSLTQSVFVHQITGKQTSWRNIGGKGGPKSGLRPILPASLSTSKRLCLSTTSVWVIRRRTEVCYQISLWSIFHIYMIMSCVMSDFCLSLHW